MKKLYKSFRGRKDVYKMELERQREVEQREHESGFWSQEWIGSETPNPLNNQPQPTASTPSIVFPHNLAISGTPTSVALNLNLAAQDPVQSVTNPTEAIGPPNQKKRGKRPRTKKEQPHMRIYVKNRGKSERIAKM
ncbi:hypothetical protein Tco_0233138 [Tanacetum coccineum]